MNGKIHVAVLKVNTHTFRGVIHNLGMKTVGDRLRDLRLARKLTQQQIAKAIGVKQGSYTQLETGKSKSPRGENLTKLARFYDVDPEWLMTGKGTQHPVSSLSDQESDLIVLFRTLSTEGRAYVLGRARSVQGDEREHTSPSRRASDTRPPVEPPNGPDGH